MIEMLGVSEAARKYSLPVHALRRWVKQGDIPACKTGRRFLICADNVERFLHTGNTSTPQAESGKIRKLY